MIQERKNMSLKKVDIEHQLTNSCTIDDSELLQQNLI